MHLGYDAGKDSNEPLTAADFGVVEEAPAGASSSSSSSSASSSSSTVPQKSRNLFADYTVQSYFRRPDFTPDGTLLITPTGIHRPNAPGSKGPAADKDDPGNSFCTHIFYREHMSSPILSLAGLEDPSVAVRCCPVLFKLVRTGEAVPTCMVAGKYRVVFAVVTLTAVYVYDTQHPYPLARVGGLHFACINDATWSADGASVVISLRWRHHFPLSTLHAISLSTFLPFPSHPFVSQAACSLYALRTDT